MSTRELNFKMAISKVSQIFLKSLFWIFLCIERYRNQYLKNEILCGVNNEMCSYKTRIDKIELERSATWICPLGYTKISKSFRNSILTWYMLYLYEGTPKMQKKDFWGVVKSAHFQVPESGTSSARIQKLRPHFTPTSPQNGRIGVCFIHLPLLDA